MANPAPEPVREIPLRFLSVRVGHAAELRAHYAPPRRFSPTILHVVPWLSVLLLAGLTGFFWVATSRLPGRTADLELAEQPFADGARSSVSIAAKPDRVAGTPCLILEGSTYLLSSEEQKESFLRSLTEKLSVNNEETVLIFEDRALSHGTTIELADLVRRAGARRACFVTEE